MKCIAAAWIALFTATMAAAGTLSLSPAVINLRGEPGESTTQRLVLTNATNVAVSFELAAQDVVVRAGKRELVPAGEIAGSIAATAVFSQKSVTVKPGQSAAVDVTMTLTPNAASRGVVALFRGTTRILNGRVPMVPSLGTLLTFAESDDARMDIAPLAVTPPTASRNLTVAAHCVNSGSEPLVVKGVAAIIDARGTLVGRIDLPPRRMFPTETATLHGEYAGDLPRGHYRLLLTCDLGGRTITKSAEVDVR
jgi:hypothetical protein